MKTALTLTTRDSILSGWVETLQNDYTIIPCLDEEECLKEFKNYPTSTLLFHFNSFKSDIGKFLKSIHYQFPDANVFLLSDIPEFQEGIQMLRMGVKGYGNSYLNSSHLIHAMSVVSDGNVWLYPQFLDILIKETYQPQNQKKTDPRLSILSKREMEVAEYVAQGLNNNEIAELTQITLRTVKAHITSIFEKLHITDRLSLALLLR
jgi:DNA-binding NarL/FixJ family response regulator